VWGGVVEWGRIKERRENENSGSNKKWGGNAEDTG